MIKLLDILKYAEFFIVVISLADKVEGGLRPHNRERIPKIRRKDVVPAQSCLNTSIDVRLSETESSYKVVEFVIPGVNTVLPMCYPRTYVEYYEATIVSHVICRQKGYMSYDSKREKIIPFQPTKERILPSSLQCVGNEQSVAQCQWNKHSNRYCSSLLAIQCTNCSRTIEGIKGSISNPGYPYAYPHFVLCEWEIKVPHDHVIDLFFGYFLLPDEESSNCGTNTAHIEIIYGHQGAYTVHRICSLNFWKNLTIPFSKAKIRLFTGLYDHIKFKNDLYGVNITFKGIPHNGDGYSVTVQIIMFTILIVFVFIALISVYSCFHYIDKWNNGESVPQPPNAPTQAQVLEAYEFQMNVLRNKNQKSTISSSDSKSSSSRLRSRGFSSSIRPYVSTLAPLRPVSSL